MTNETATGPAALRYLLEAAVLLRDDEAARVLAERMAPLAGLLLANYSGERAAAIEHLDFAIAEFRDMKMQPSLERALRHRELLKA